MISVEPPTPSANPREEMSSRQWLAVGVCVLLNIVDGFDILVMSTAASAVRQELSLSATSLGLVLGASLAGMMLGALCLAPFADRYGRRRLILLCLTIGLVGMIAAGFSSGPAELVACRLATGLGVGGLMPVLNTIVAEVSTARRRNLAITLQAIGYPAGGLAAALVGSTVLKSHGWRLLLQSACLPAIIGLLAVLLFLPESVSFLLLRRPADALTRINAALRTLGKQPMTVLPPSAQGQPKSSLRALLLGPYTSALALFASATFLTQFSFYFFISWLPTILQPHLAAGSKAGAAMALNFGGIVGDLIFGALCLRVRVRPLTLSALAISFLSASLLGQVLETEMLAMTLVMVAGAALFAAMAGIYAIAPDVFPTLIRASGTGFTFSLGRLGGALSPLIGAYVLNALSMQLGLGLISMALPMVAASALLAGLRLQQRRLQ
ncbi:MAG TPA: MFS transporter [Steroidobacteraceae bacterium]|jgi:MFS family permease